MKNPERISPQIADRTGIYFQELSEQIRTTEVTMDKGEITSLAVGVNSAVDHIMSTKRNSAKVFLIGNGGSAAICSHAVIDLWNAGVRAAVFNDPSGLTCIGNDFGYENVFSRPLELFAEERDLLIAVSSSGKSQNIINGVDRAIDKQCRVITFSGFLKDNPLRTKGVLNFYTPSSKYGLVETSHMSILHCITDFIFQTEKQL